MTGLIHDLTMRAVTTFYRRVVVLGRQLADPIPDVQPELPVRITPLSEQDIPAYRTFRPDQPPAAIAERLAEGKQCFAAWHEGQIVQAVWSATTRAHIDYLHRDMILEPLECYLYDSYTLPRYRARGLASARSAFVLRSFRERGYERSIGVVAVENKKAFGVWERVGYRPLGLYGCWRCGGWQRDWQETWGAQPLPKLVRPAGSP
jgi:ribosomal protein S18 acetylase RimI-like enzyme